MEQCDRRTCKPSRARARIPSDQIQARAAVGTFQIRSSAIVYVYGTPDRSRRQRAVVVTVSDSRRRRCRPTSSAHALRGRGGIGSDPGGFTQHGVRTALLFGRRRSLSFPLLSLALVHVCQISP